MSHIFISYATRDGTDAAHQLVVALEAAGRTCWIMGRDVKAGEPFPGQIVAAIRESCGLVVLVTQGANQSRDVLQEVHKAHNDGKVIVPVILQGTKPSDDLSYYLDVRQQVVWTEAQGVMTAVAGVFGAPGGEAVQDGRDSPVDAVLAEIDQIYGERLTWAREWIFRGKLQVARAVLHPLLRSSSPERMAEAKRLLEIIKELWEKEPRSEEDKEALQLALQDGVRPGGRVLHVKYGEGVVQEMARAVGGRCSVFVIFDSVGEVVVQTKELKVI
jgi:hypothetical protein